MRKRYDNSDYRKSTVVVSQFYTTHTNIDCCNCDTVLWVQILLEVGKYGSPITG